MYGHRFLQRDVDVGGYGHGNIHPADADPVPDAHSQRVGQGHGDQLTGGDQLRKNLLGRLPEWHGGDAHGHPGRGLRLQWLERCLHRHRLLRGEHDERSERHGDLQEYARETLNARLLTRVWPACGLTAMAQPEAASDSRTRPAGHGGLRNISLRQPFAELRKLLPDGSPSGIPAHPRRRGFTEPPCHGVVPQKAHHRDSERGGPSASRSSSLS